MMKLALASDLHGNLGAMIPRETVDTIVLAGDLVPGWAVNQPAKEALMRQADWVITRLYKRFADLIADGFCKDIIWTWGNHDWIGQYHDWEQGRNTLLPEPPPHCHLLVDQALVLDGIKFYGTPWQPVFYN